MNIEKYCNIYDGNRNHVKNLIKWIFDEVISAGGDGDALWYSRFFHVNDILPLVEEINLEHKWNIERRLNYDI